MRVRKQYPLKSLTTMKVGGAAAYFLRLASERALIESIGLAERGKTRWTVVGEGSNLIPDDAGFNGLIIKNEIRCLAILGTTVRVGAGNNLCQTIKKLNHYGLAGMEKMAGIPGTIGGAIYGCAGAYGQEIKDHLKRVRIFDGRKVIWLSKRQCRFTYRESIFKKKKTWVIIEAQFKFPEADPQKLLKTSKEIIKIREQKYPPGLLCPGSFFKNIVLKNLPLSEKKNLLPKINREKIISGKVPTGYLLELVGAKGLRRGGILVAAHHANLILNTGNGTTREIKRLARLLKKKVRDSFGIELEEEIQYLP